MKVNGEKETKNAFTFSGWLDSLPARRWSWFSSPASLRHPSSSLEG